MHDSITIPKESLQALRNEGFNKKFFVMEEYFLPVGCYKSTAVVELLSRILFEKVQKTCSKSDGYMIVHLVKRFMASQRLHASCKTQAARPGTVFRSHR